MDWQFKVGLGLAFVFGLLPFTVKDMPHWVTWPGTSIGILFIIWGILHAHLDIPIGPAILFIVCIAGIVGSIAWYNIAISQHHTTIIEPDKQPTAEEIATEVIKKMPTDKTKLVGNLRERAIALSDEIMEDLYIHGWPQRHSPQYQKTKPYIVIQQLPTTNPDEINKWVSSRSRYFRYSFLKRVIDIKNELSQLHLKDEDLDQLIKSQEQYPPQQLDLPNPILPQMIEEVAECLKKLAEHIKD